MHFVHMATGILCKIEEKAGNISEEDIDDWIVPELMEHYRHRINFLANKAYRSGSNSIPTIARKAFEEQSRIRLKKALETFFLKKEYWKEGREISPYLLKSLKILSTEISWDQDSAKRKNAPVCPACRLYKRREFLIAENKMLRCTVCTREANRILVEMENSKSSFLSPKHRLFSTFSLHSRKGYKCPYCNRFIPASIKTSRGISCPYINCIYFGHINFLKEMSHPVGVYSHHNVSLNAEVDMNQGNGGVGRQLQDTFKSDDISPDDMIQIRTQVNKEYEILLSVIDKQVACVKRTNSKTTLKQKLLMYEAFRRMAKRYPEEMVSYLVHRKQHPDFPIQTRIFQTYVSLVENALPFCIKKGGKNITILSLTDSNLALFLGISEFEAVVGNNFKIPNRTKETYIGGRKGKNYGPCFIGDVIDITHNGKSIKEKMIEHGFQHISMDRSVKPGTKVKVRHFRIPSHYEMDSMVYLQRIRRQLVDSIYLRIHGKKRPTRGSSNEQ